MADGKVVENKDEMTFNMFGMERQNLHNTALFMVYDPRIPNDLKQKAEAYLSNLLVAATNDLAEKWLG